MSNPILGKCPYCQADGAQVITTTGRMMFLQCPSCGLNQRHVRNFGESPMDLPDLFKTMLLPLMRPGVDPSDELLEASRLLNKFLLEVIEPMVGQLGTEAVLGEILGLYQRVNDNRWPAQIPAMPDDVGWWSFDSHRLSRWYQQEWKVVSHVGNALANEHVMPGEVLLLNAEQLRKIPGMGKKSVKDLLDHRQSLTAVQSAFLGSHNWYGKKRA